MKHIQKFFYGQWPILNLQKRFRLQQRSKEQNFWPAKQQGHFFSNLPLSPLLWKPVTLALRECRDYSSHRKNVQIFSNGKNVTITDRLCRSCQSIANALSPEALRAEPLWQSALTKAQTLIPFLYCMLQPDRCFQHGTVTSTLKPKLHPSLPMELLCS